MSKNEEKVKNPRALLWWKVNSNFPFLKEWEIREDLEQEIERILLEAEFEGITTIKEMVNFFARELYAFTRRMRRTVAEWRIATSSELTAWYVRNDYEGSAPHPYIETIFSTSDVTSRLAGERLEREALLQKCKQAIDELSLHPDLDWAIFLLYLSGRRQEIHELLGTHLDPKIVEVAIYKVVTIIRRWFGVDESKPLAIDMHQDVGECPFDVEYVPDPRDSLPERVYPNGHSHHEIMRRYGVSRQTSYRAREKRDWLSPGWHIPRMVYWDVYTMGVVTQETEFNLHEGRGRSKARRWLLCRDGYWWEDDAIWIHCGLCGEPMMIGEATIDHVTPRSEGGSDQLRNLVLAHEDCNKAKGSRLPSLQEAGLSREAFN